MQSPSLLNHLKYYDSTRYNINKDNKSDVQSGNTTVRSLLCSPPSSSDSASSTSAPECQDGENAKEALRESYALTTTEEGVSIIG
jgi:hypothetical protein